MALGRLQLDLSIRSWFHPSLSGEHGQVASSLGFFICTKENNNNNCPAFWDDCEDSVRLHVH